MTATLSESFSVAQVSVATTATKIWTGTGGTDVITIQNLGANVVTIGPTSGVTAANGFPIPGTSGASLSFTTTQDIWAIATTAATNVAVLRTGT